MEAQVRERLGELLHRKNWLLVSDRDGTLAPYTVDPAASKMPESTVKTLAALATLPNTHVALLSARSITFLLTDIGDAPITLAGSYGTEVLYSDKQRVTEPDVTAFKDAFEILRVKLREILPAARTIIDDNELSICLHHHLTPPDMMPAVEAEVDRIASEIPILRRRRMQTSVEFLPDFDWDKGRGLARVAEYLNLADDEDTFFLFAGDTEADEPGFEYVLARGGTAVRVGNQFSGHKDYSCDNPEVAGQLFQQLLAIRSPEKFRELQAELAD